MATAAGALRPLDNDGPAPLAAAPTGWLAGWPGSLKRARLLTGCQWALAALLLKARHCFAPYIYCRFLFRFWDGHYFFSLAGPRAPRGESRGAQLRSAPSHGHGGMAAARRQREHERAEQ